MAADLARAIGESTAALLRQLRADPSAPRIEPGWLRAAANRIGGGLALTAASDLAATRDLFHA